MPSIQEDIDDIEDLIAPGDLLPSDRYHNKQNVVIRSRKSRVADNQSEEKEKANVANQKNGSVSYR